MPYRVPEVWLFKKNQLIIYSLQGDAAKQPLPYRYSEKTNSRYFPTINLCEVITECLRITYERNSSAAIRQLRQKLERDN